MSTLMLSELVADHIIHLAKKDGQWTSRKSISDYITNALSPGDVAAIIDMAVEMGAVQASEIEPILIKILE